MHHRVDHAFAVTALVVEKLDDCDIAIRISDHRVFRVTHDLVLKLCERVALAFLLCQFLARLHGVQGFNDHFRMRHDVIADGAVERRLLVR